MRRHWINRDKYPTPQPPLPSPTIFSGYSVAAKETMLSRDPRPIVTVDGIFWAVGDTVLCNATRTSDVIW